MRYFPAGNTGLGFYSRFDGIAKDEEIKRKIILKGGPGVGKSTVMKRKGEDGEKAGNSVKYFRCSGDPESLDAVLNETSRIMVVDGTAPHVIDPVLPGAMDEIVNLGVHLNMEGLRKERKRVSELTGMNKHFYAVAYSYLYTALCFWKSNYNTLSGMIDNTLFTKLDEVAAGCSGDDERRGLFAEAITYKGLVSFMDDYTEGVSGVLIRGRLKLHAMEYIMKKVNGGLILYDPLTATVPAHILCNEKILITTCETLANPGRLEVIDTDRFVAGNTPDFLMYNESQIDILVNRCVDVLVSCKETHDELEKIYARYMDFEAAQKDIDYILDAE